MYYNKELSNIYLDYLEKEIDGIITDDPSTLKSIVDLYLSQNEAERKKSRPDL